MVCGTSVLSAVHCLTDGSIRATHACVAFIIAQRQGHRLAQKRHSLDFCKGENCRFTQSPVKPMYLALGYKGPRCSARSDMGFRPFLVVNQCSIELHISYELE
jgi:hypothetical protein